MGNLSPMRDKNEGMFIPGWGRTEDTFDSGVSREGAGK